MCGYMDLGGQGPLSKLRRPGPQTTFKIGQVYVGALAYADDVTLLAPTSRAMRIQLKICEEYSEKFRIV